FLAFMRIPLRCVARPFRRPALVRRRAAPPADRRPPAARPGQLSSSRLTQVGSLLVRGGGRLPREYRRGPPGVALPRLVAAVAVLFVTLLFYVHRPDVVRRAVEDVLHAEHRGEHRVILVVVPVHAVAPDRVHVWVRWLPATRG